MARKSQAEKVRLSCVICGKPFFRRPYDNTSITCSASCKNSRRRQTLKHWAKNNKERISSAARRYALRYPDRVKAAGERYRKSEKGKAKRAASQNVYRAAHPERVKEMRQRQRKRDQKAFQVLRELIGKEKLNELLASI